MKFNTNGKSLITREGVTPHPIPLPGGREGRVRGLLVKELNAFVLVKKFDKIFGRAYKRVNKELRPREMI